MWVFSVLLILIATYWCIRKKQVSFYDALPLSVCGMIVLLFGLAFLRGLYFVDVIGCVVTICLAAYLMHKKKMYLIADFVRVIFLDARIWGVILFVGIATFMTWDKIALWWDDINFWAADAKFLYYYGGFAPKYGNVAPEFGDYPPVMSLVKWLFLHANSSKFCEGLLFAAYYSFHVILLLPLLAHSKNGSPLYHIVAVLFLFLVPGMIDHVYVEGACADVTMGILYGNYLWSIWQDKRYDEKVYLLRITIYGSVLVLCKSVGIEWMAFGAVLCMVLKFVRKNETGVLTKIKWIKIMGALCVPIIIEMIWLMFCFFNRRVAKLTSAGVKMAVSGNLSFLENAKEKAKIFVDGFFQYPMHTSYGWGLDISSGVFLILITIICVWFWRRNWVEKREGVLLVCYTLFTAFAAYGIIFLGHITIFAGEAQYQDPRVMAMSIARYGAPFAMGMMVLLFSIWFDLRAKQVLTETEKPLIRDMKVYLPFIVVVFMLTNVTDAKDALFLHKETVQEDLAGRIEMLEPSGQLYAEKCKSLPQLPGNRVLYLREDSTIHWVKDTYISYEVSPVATVYAGIDTTNMCEADMIQRMSQSHATYLYCDAVKGNATQLFANLVTEGEFEYETFYRILWNAGGVQLEKVVEEGVYE